MERKRHVTLYQERQRRLKEARLQIPDSIAANIRRTACDTTVGKKSRFFRVEAAGDIDEDKGERIAATEITLVEELDARKFAYYIMRYIAMYPRRKNWITNMTGVSIQPDKAKVSEAGHIAIARGSSPRVRGTEGSVVGLIVEKDEEIKNMKMLVVTSKYADKWLYIDKNRQLHVEEDV